MEFIQKYAKIDDDEVHALSIDSTGVENVCKLTLSDEEFIDDLFVNQSLSEYSIWMNVTISKDGAQKRPHPFS